MTRELRGLDAALAAPGRAARLEYHDTGHSLDRGVEWVLKPGPVLLAVNADPNPVDVTFHGLLPGGAARGGSGLRRSGWRCCGRDYAEKEAMSEQHSLAAFRRTVVESACKKILFLPYAIRQMSRPDRNSPDR